MSSRAVQPFALCLLAAVAALVFGCTQAAPEGVSREPSPVAPNEREGDRPASGDAHSTVDGRDANSDDAREADAARPSGPASEHAEDDADAVEERATDAEAFDSAPPRAARIDGGSWERDGGRELGSSPPDASRDGAAVKPQAMFRNPLQEQGPDPWLLYHDGAYYLATTTWSSQITMRRATTLAGLKSAEEVVVWTGDQPSRCCNIWAPEFHLLDGPNGKRWYLYFSAGPAGMNTDNQRNHVLESAGLDPRGPYTYKARVYDARHDLWAIDASVVTIEGKTYFLYSAWEGQDQGVYIAAMSNPWTLSSSRVRIARPTYAWETSLARVNEAPVALQRNGRTFVIYSASACWGPDYKLGMLTLTGTDPLAESSWRKHPEPVFQRADRARAFGPGHNGFFSSPDGTETWIVYHANASAQGACDMKRAPRAQKISWNTDGTPNLGAPVALDVGIAVPSGE